MPIELEKESKNLNKYIDYVEAQVNYTQEELTQLAAFSSHGIPNS